METKASNSDILLHRSSKICSVRKPLYIMKDIKIQTGLLSPNNKYSEFSFHPIREGGWCKKLNTAWTLLCACHCAIPLTCAMSLNLHPATLWSRHSNSNENLRVEFAHDQRFKPTPDNPKLGFIFHTGHFLWRNQPCRIDEKDEDGDEESGVKIAGRKARRNSIHYPGSPWSGT